MTVRADMVNGHAICHGGFVFTLADSAFAFACNSYNAQHGRGGCTIEFLAPSHEGDVLTAMAHERTQVGRNGIYDVDVQQPERRDTIALFRGKSTRIKGHVSVGRRRVRDREDTASGRTGTDRAREPRRAPRAAARTTALVARARVRQRAALPQARSMRRACIRAT